jgi:plasmid stabilization system protein ParE
MPYGVVFDVAALQDLKAIFDYIEPRAGAPIAERFVTQLHTHCLGLRDFPERGTRRDDLRPGLRTLGYKRRATILFQIEHEPRKVRILGIYYRGRDFESQFIATESD